MDCNYEPRKPITIPAHARIYVTGSDGYAEFVEDGVTRRVRVTFFVERGGQLLAFNTDELIDSSSP